MTIFDLLNLICGLALFLYGMEVMGEALKRGAGSRLKIILGKMTSSRPRGFLLGLGVTAIIQSSSATTVMVVGFVNSGTMALRQAVDVIVDGARRAGRRGFCYQRCGLVKAIVMDPLAGARRHLPADVRQAR